MAAVIPRTRLETMQVLKLLQCVRQRDRTQIQRLTANGVPGLLDYTDPSLLAPATTATSGRTTSGRKVPAVDLQTMGDTALTLAVADNDIDLVDFLLKLGAHPDAPDRRGRTPACRAAERGNVECLQRLLRAGANVSIADVEGKGILFYCIDPSDRHVLCAQLAISRGADVNCRSNATAGRDDGVTVLQAACADAKANENICLMLLEYGAEPNFPIKVDEAPVRATTALIAACASEGERVVKTLLERGARVDDVDRTGSTAVHVTSKTGNIVILQMLAAYGAQMNISDVRGNTAMHRAAEKGHAPCCTFLAQRGCNPKHKNRDGLTAYQLAKQLGFRLAAKACRRAETVYGKPDGSVTPSWAISLYDFCYHRRQQLLEAFESADGDRLGRVSRQHLFDVLQEAGAPLPDEPSDLSTLASVHESRDRPGAELTIDYNQFLTGKKYIGKKYLAEAFIKKKKKKKKKKGRRKKRRGGKRGRKTRIPVAICTRPMGPRAEDGGPPDEFVPRQYCITDASRFNYADDGNVGDTRKPSHYLEDDSWWYLPPERTEYVQLNDAVRHGDLETLKGTVIDNGPLAVDRRDRFYKTPLMTATSEGNLEVVQYLVNNGADVNAKDNFSWTPLHFACRSGRCAVIELLLDAGASINAVTMAGATPLMRAVESGRPAVVRMMLDRGADIRPANRKGKTAMDLAKTYGDQRVFEIVKEKWMAIQPKSKKSSGKVQSQGDSDSTTKTPGSVRSASKKARGSVN